MIDSIMEEDKWATKILKTEQCASPVETVDVGALQNVAKEEDDETAGVSPAGDTTNQVDQMMIHPVFHNDLVWRQLGDYLNFDDLKDCRLVCRLFNRKILDMTTFKERAVIDIPLTMLTLQGFGSTRESWKHLAIEVDRLYYDRHESPGHFWDPTTASSQDLHQALTSITSLILYRRVDDDCDDDRDPSRPSAAIRTKVTTIFETMFAAMTSLKSLSVDPGIFQEVDPCWFIASASTHLIPRLVSFELIDFGGKNSRSISNDLLHSGLALAASTNKLESFKLGNLTTWDWTGRHSSTLAVLNNRLRRVCTILRQNHRTLSQLELYDPEVWSRFCAERFGPFPPFPSLRSFQTRVSRASESPTLVQFLRIQPATLEEIDLEFETSVPSSLMETLKRFAGSLRVLRLSTLSKFKPSHLKKWAFLKDTTRLEEFSFRVKGRSVRVRNSQLVDFFSTSLPRNAKRIELCGVKPLMGAGAAPLQLQVSWFSPKTLTHLTLRRCTGLLRNSILQSFWKELTGLVALELSNAGPSCTDWGFTGVPVGRAKQGVAISNLKGLKSLTLQNCKNITNRTLVEGIKFTELQFLDLSGNYQFTEKGFKAVLSQNPSLRRLWSERSVVELELRWRRPLSSRSRWTHQISARLTREYGLDYAGDYSHSDWELDEDTTDGTSSGNEGNPLRGFLEWGMNDHHLYLQRIDVPEEDTLEEEEEDDDEDDENAEDHEPPYNREYRMVERDHYYYDGPPEDAPEDEEDEEELPDLDNEGDWLIALLNSKKNQAGPSGSSCSADAAPVSVNAASNAAAAVPAQEQGSNVDAAVAPPKDPEINVAATTAPLKEPETKDAVAMASRNELKTNDVDAPANDQITTVAVSPGVCNVAIVRVGDAVGDTTTAEQTKADDATESVESG